MQNFGDLKIASDVCIQIRFSLFFQFCIKNRKDSNACITLTVQNFGKSLFWNLPLREGNRVSVYTPPATKLRCKIYAFRWFGYTSFCCWCWPCKVLLKLNCTNYVNIIRWKKWGDDSYKMLLKTISYRSIIIIEFFLMFLLLVSLIKLLPIFSQLNK